MHTDAYANYVDNRRIIASESPGTHRDSGKDGSRAGWSGGAHCPGGRQTFGKTWRNTTETGGHTTAAARLMVLVDTSVWVEHFRTGHSKFAEILEAGLVLMHPFVQGELACGNLRHRSQALLDLS